MEPSVARPSFVFVAKGTHGDVLPLLAAARGLRERGYDCTLLANASFRTRVEASRVGFTALTVEGDGQDDPRSGVEATVFPGYEPISRFFAEHADAAERMLVVNLRSFCASNLACERYGIASVRAYLSPAYVPSVSRPPPDDASRPAQWAEVVGRRDEDPGVLERMNRLRAHEGLPPLPSAQRPTCPSPFHVALFPDWYAGHTSDWPKDLKLLGFPLPASQDTLPKRLEAFLAVHERPMVFTPGTAPTMLTEHFFEQAILACEALGLPAVFLNPRFPTTLGTLPASMIHVDYVDLDLILRHSRGLVHHGGIGTTARALEAGIPQVVSPLLYDQPDNARCIEALGVGRCLHRAELSATSLVSVLSEVLDDASSRARLDDVRRRIRESCSLPRLVDTLEALAVTSRFPGEASGGHEAEGGRKPQERMPRTGPATAGAPSSSNIMEDER